MGDAMGQPTQPLEHASVKQYCKALRVPVIGSNLVRLSEQAIKEQRSHIGYVEGLLAMEAKERDRHAIGRSRRLSNPLCRFGAVCLSAPFGEV